MLWRIWNVANQSTQVQVCCDVLMNSANGSAGDFPKCRSICICTNQHSSLNVSVFRLQQFKICRIIHKHHLAEWSRKEKENVRQKICFISEINIELRFFRIDIYKFTVLLKIGLRIDFKESSIFCLFKQKSEYVEKHVENEPMVNGIEMRANTKDWYTNVKANAYTCDSVYELCSPPHQQQEWDGCVARAV